MKKKSFIFTVSFLRDILQIEKDKYKLFTNFKAKVIEKARKELELKHKSFFFSYKEIKI
ncbi:MAG: RepB family plasmid replication initiator protein [Candidatus Electrothrix sp. GM3_4]|nr:RepB family plasmid replication initiator protein [Candidatus Electrothrix sp. GM3_4]